MDSAKTQIAKAQAKQKKMAASGQPCRRIAQDEDEDDAGETSTMATRRMPGLSRREESIKLIGDVILPKNEPGEEGVRRRTLRVRAGSCDSECHDKAEISASASRTASSKCVTTLEIVTRRRRI